MRKSYDELIRRIANHTDSDFRWVEQKFTEMIDFISNRDELFAELKAQKEKIAELENKINRIGMSNTRSSWKGDSSWE